MEEVSGEERIQNIYVACPGLLPAYFATVPWQFAAEKIQDGYLGSMEALINRLFVHWICLQLSSDKESSFIWLLLLVSQFILHSGN